MKRYLKIYKEAIIISIKSAITYRLNFFLNSFIMLLSNILFPLVTVLVYGSGASFQGWSMYEVILIQSLFTISNGIASMLFQGILWETMFRVSEGNYEIILIKPVDYLFQLLCSAISIESIGLILGGVIMFVVSYLHIQTPSLTMWLMCIVLFLMGLAIMFGIALLMAATSFKWVANSRIPEIFNSIKEFGKYPQSIFPKVVIGISSFVFPVAMIGFFPAAALLGRVQMYMVLSVIPCILFVIAGVSIYRHMVHLYEGVGG